MKRLLRKAVNLVLDFFYPKECLGCGVAKTYLCVSCLEKISFLETQVCFLCHRPSIHALTHPRCVKKGDLDSLLVASVYEGLLKKIIKTFKYRFVQELSAPLAHMLVNLSKDKLPQVDLITFVPITKHKQKLRGFNQAYLLAFHFAERQGLGCIATLAKLEETKNQAELKREERMANLKKAFTCTKNVAGKRILLLDDVSTTGTTLNECSKALKKSGATKVYGLVLARGI